MQPTIGRIVHYHSYGTPNGEYKSEPRAAIITGVVDEEIVHLCVLNPTGHQGYKFYTGVSLVDSRGGRKNKTLETQVRFLALVP